MIQKFNRKTINLIATFQGLPQDTSRAFFRKEKDMDAVMDQVIRQYQIGNSHPEEVIASEWVGLVGERNARHANPWRLDRGQRLFIRVNNPVVKQEMQFGKQFLLNRIRQLPGCDGIRQIIFRAG